MAHSIGMAPIRWIAVLGLSAALSSALFLAAPAFAAAPQPGEKAPAFTLKTVDKGDARTLESFTKTKGGKGAVVVFLSCKCPYVAQARAPLAELVKQYGGKVSFVGLNANQNEKADDVRSDAALNF